MYVHCIDRFIDLIIGIGITPQSSIYIAIYKLQLLEQLPTMSRLLIESNFMKKVVLITGASSGIGLETAIQFARQGAHISMCGRNKERLDRAYEECTKERIENTQQIIRIQCDMTNDNDVKSMVEQTLTTFDGRLDVLVNNAGTLEYGTIENTSLEQYDRVMNTNLRSVYHMMMLTVPSLAKTKGLFVHFVQLFNYYNCLFFLFVGNVINVSSVNGIRSFPNVLAYNISKSALDQLTACTALELASKGIRVNAVNPGVINTGIQQRGGLTDEQYANFMEHSKTTHALGRVGEVGEVAKVITFLASDSASFVTGITMPIDGGRHAMCPR